MEEETEEEVVPLGHEQYTENSLSGKVHQDAPRPPAAVWKTVKRLRDVTLMANVSVMMMAGLCINSLMFVCAAGNFSK